MPKSAGSKEKSGQDKAVAAVAVISPRTFLVAGLTAGALQWLSLPPLSWWPLGWLAPGPLLWMIQQPGAVGRNAYKAAWLAGFAYWVAALHWLRLPHPATALGGVALCAYLGCYIPLFLAICRGAVHRLRWPLPMIAPVAWVGLEYARARLITGISMGELEHGQCALLPLLQVVDIAGQYTLSFLMVAVAALCIDAWRRSLSGVLIRYAASAALLLAAWLYGEARLDGLNDSKPGPKLLLIQGNVPTIFDNNLKRYEDGYVRYKEISALAAAAHPDADVMIWPESMYIYGWYSDPPSGVEVDEHYAFIAADRRYLIRELADAYDMPLILNAGRRQPTMNGGKKYNSALYFDRRGELVEDGIYDKNHLVLFGEYIPGGELFPELYEWTPLSGGFDAGDGPAAFDVDGTIACPTVCYETVLPHVVRGLVNELEEQGQAPDLLLNLTNDGWFWGSSELDLHLACNIFRAVENRLPLAVAANTGFSASIDSCGRIRTRAEKLDETHLVDSPPLDDRSCLYRRIGDLPAFVMLLISLGVGATAARRRSRTPENVSSG